MKSLNITRLTVGITIILGLLFYQPLAYLAGAMMIFAGLTGICLLEKFYSRLLHRDVSCSPSHGSIAATTDSASQTTRGAPAPTAPRESRRQHWNRVYESKEPQEVSWYQLRPDLSLALIVASGVAKDAGILDVGGGTSSLVDCLLDAGFTRPGVLDISGASLNRSRARLGARATAVEWFEEDVTSFRSPRRFGLWHDRAVFHFLTDADDRRKYIETLKRTLEPGGAAIIATFAADGPEMCSGLRVTRWDERSLAAELGAEFHPLETRRETHITPWKAGQRFLYIRFQYHPAVEQPRARLEHAALRNR